MLSMSKALRLLSVSALIGGALYLVRGVDYVLDTVLWVGMMYLVIGSITGGVRVAVAQFTRRPVAPARGNLGISWVILTMLLLRVLFGIVPAQGSKSDRASEAEIEKDGRGG